MKIYETQLNIPVKLDNNNLIGTLPTQLGLIKDLTTLFKTKQKIARTRYPLQSYGQARNLVHHRFFKR